MTRFSHGEECRQGIKKGFRSWLLRCGRNRNNRLLFFVQKATHQELARSKQGQSIIPISTVEQVMTIVHLTSLTPRFDPTFEFVASTYSPWKILLISHHNTLPVRLLAVREQVMVLRRSCNPIPGFLSRSLTDSSRL